MRLAVSAALELREGTMFKSKKLWLILALAAAALVVLAACGDDEEEVPPPPAGETRQRPAKLRRR